MRLPLSRPSALAGAREGVWIADAGSGAACLFDAASADILARVPFDRAPVSIAATNDIVTIALDSGEVVAIGASDRDERWRRRCESGAIRLAAARDRVWAWDRGAASFLAWEGSGAERRFDASGAVTFAAADAGVYSLTAAGGLRFQPLIGTSVTAHLPYGAVPTGALAACANSLWVAVENGLLLAAHDTLAPRSTLPLKGGRITHIICFHGRLFAAGRGVYALEPAADDNIRTLDVTLTAPPLGLAASGTHLWVLERTAPEVHVTRIP